MAAVTTPVDGFTGTVAGVAFVDGKGDTDDDNALAYFRRHGYDVAEKPKRAPRKAKADDESAD
ncbi:hypothetical protein [Rhodococcus sp. SJ-2]